MTKTVSAGQKLRADLDVALANAAEELGRPLEFDEAERHVIDQARAGVACRWWTRAVLQPGGTIAYHDDDGSQFLAENGL
jgi:hypothetical protein